MPRRTKLYQINRGPSAQERLHAGICATTPAHDAWLLRRREFIDGLPRLQPGEVLELLEHAERVRTAVTFHRLRKTVLEAPDGEHAWNAFGPRWMQFYGGGRLPATWWHGWPEDLRIYGGE